MPVVCIPAAYRRFTDQIGELPTDAATVGEALNELAAKYPDLGSMILHDDGAVRPVVKVYVGETDIETLGGLETELGPREEIVLLPPIAGG